MFQSLFALPTPLEVVFTVGPVTRDVEETLSLISSLRSMLFKHVKTNFVHFEKCLWIICYPERIIGLKFCGDSNIKHPRFCQKSIYWSGETNFPLYVINRSIYWNLNSVFVTFIRKQPVRVVTHRTRILKSYIMLHMRALS